jgi:hypothetical protein
VFHAEIILRFNFVTMPTTHLVSGLLFLRVYLGRQFDLNNINYITIRKYNNYSF